MDQDRYHYGVVRRAIGIIDAEGPRLTLGALAARLGMSEAHLQRVFSAWAGVSPKRLAQYLALGQAKALLAERRRPPEVAEAVGLSAPSRLHDLFVTWEAMTPARWAEGGEGLTLREGRFDSPFGPVIAMATERGLCGLAFAAEEGEEAARADLLARWPRAKVAADAEAIRPWVEAAFGGGGGEARVHAIGAPFQIKVWEALLSVPSGHVATYGDLAAAAGAPRAVRATGTAVGRNPVAWLIPCHRAIRATVALGGYRWGLPVKRAMLAWESAREADGRNAA